MVNSGAFMDSFLVLAVVARDLARVRVDGFRTVGLMSEKITKIKLKSLD